MKTLLSLLFLLFSVEASAQNYQCLQAGVKHYFINGNGYLRGIRIDSVKTSGDTVVYYPFHTPRGYYAPTGYGSILDSTGGSWLGKRVLQLNDGTFLFDNLWKDTIVIKTQANVGDTWVFCRDTSTLYYQATLISMDTMTVLGILDSVKKILITALDTSGIVTTDLADSFEINLSKNNGFVQIFDLNTFPYHPPDSSYRSGLDYYLDATVSMPGYPVPFDFSTVYGTPDKNNSLFTLTPFTYPTLEQLTQWNIGDAYEYSICSPYIEISGTSCFYPNEYDMDTIKTKNTTATDINYGYSGWSCNSIPSSYSYSISSKSGVLAFDTTLIIDSILMPEEYKQYQCYYYMPMDTSFCMPGALYGISWGDRFGTLFGTMYSPVFEYAAGNLYKGSLGLLHSYSASAADWGFDVGDQTLIYYYRGGQQCGSYTVPPLSVQTVSPNNFNIFPNPANDQLTIQTNNTQPYTITLCNTIGQVIKTFQSNKQQETIDVSRLHAGLYYLSVIDENGTRVNNKVVIVH